MTTTPLGAPWTRTCRSDKRGRTPGPGVCARRPESATGRSGPVPVPRAGATPVRPGARGGQRRRDRPRPHSRRACSRSARAADSGRSGRAPHPTSRRPRSRSPNRRTAGSRRERSPPVPPLARRGPARCGTSARPVPGTSCRRRASAALSHPDRRLLPPRVSRPGAGGHRVLRRHLHEFLTAFGPPARRCARPACRTGARRSRRFGTAGPRDP